MITDMHVHLMGDNGARLLASASHCGIGRLIVSDLADWSEFPEENAIRAGNDRAAAFAAGAPGRVSLIMAHFFSRCKSQLPFGWKISPENRTGPAGGA